MFTGHKHQHGAGTEQSSTNTINWAQAVSVTDYIGPTTPLTYITSYETFRKVLKQVRMTSVETLMGRIRAGIYDHPLATCTLVPHVPSPWESDKRYGTS